MTSPLRDPITLAAAVDAPDRRKDAPMSNRTMTWRVGKPCPACGETEPHDLVSADGMYCAPTEDRRRMADTAGHLLFGLEGAEHLGFDETRIRARIAGLRSVVAAGQPRLYKSKP